MSANSTSTSTSTTENAPTLNSDTNGLDATIVSSKIGHKKQEEDNTEKVGDGEELKNIKKLVQECKTAINEADKNAEDAFKYQSQVNLFIERNSVKDKEGKIDIEKTKKNIGYEEPGENTVFVGNAGHGTNFLEKYIGRWVVGSEKKWNIDGEYSYTGKFNPKPAKHVKDVGVEGLGGDQHFYGKFEESKRKSGIYTWKKGELKFLGQFDGDVSGCGCWEKEVNNSKEYIVGKFTSKENKIQMPSDYLVFTTDKTNHNVRWFAKNSKDYKIFIESDRTAIMSAFGLDKVTQNFKNLGIIENAIQQAEGFTGYGRTALGVGALVAAAGLGYLAYKKWWSKKSSPAKKTQKSRYRKFMNPDDYSSSSSSSSSEKKKKTSPAAASSNSNASSASASASASPAIKIEEKDSNASPSAAVAAKSQPKRVYQTRSKVATPVSASSQTTVKGKDSNAPAKPTVNKRSEKKVTMAPVRRSARLNRT